MKTFLFNENGIKVAEELSFEDLHERFFKSIQKETWSMVKRYSFLDRDQVEQQYTIELWEAFKRYDISKGQCISTYIYWRFNRAKSDLLHPEIGSKKAKFEKSNINSYDKPVELGSETTFANQKFEQDKSYGSMVQNQPDNVAIEKELFSIVNEFLDGEEERDLVNVLIDKKEYSVADYAKKWGISRMAANKRLQKLRAKLAVFLSDKWM